jgi:urease accessory protein
VAVAATTRDGDGPTLTHLSCSGALAGRLTADGLILVGAAAHPIGDDRLSIDLAVGDGTALTVGSTGATVARHGSRDGCSLTTTTASVGAGSSLCWLVEPGVAATGARHRSRAIVELARSSRLVWREEIVLGRFAEDVPGSWRSEMAVRRDSRPFFVGDLDLGPAAPSWRSASVFAGAAAVTSTILVDPARPEGTWPRVTASSRGALGVVLPLAGPGVELVAWGAALPSCRAVASELLAGLDVEWLPSRLSKRQG